MELRGPIVGVPLGDGDEVAVRVGGWAGGWGETGLVGDAGADGFGEGVVDFEDRALGAVVAYVALLFAGLEYQEGVENVGRIAVGNPVEVEERGVKFGTDLGAAGGVPAERRAVVSEVSSETGESSAYGLCNVQERGDLFIAAGVEVYQGMIIGENSRGEDLDISPCKTKKDS